MFVKKSTGKGAQTQTANSWMNRAIVIAFAGLTAACAPAKQTTAIEASTGHDTGIIGGVNATGNEDFSKTIVSIFNAQQGSICTGSIYSNSIIITAAHCVDGPAKSIYVLFGREMFAKVKVLNPQTGKEEEKLTINKENTIRRVDAYEVSPFWAIRQYEEFNNGDIAVVKFSGGLAPGYKAAELLGDASVLKTGATITLAGYGLSDGIGKKGSGTLRYVDTEIKNGAYTKSEILVEQSKGKGACHGDSGGPAYIRVGNSWKLFGVTSRGVDDSGDTCGVSAAYTSIPFWASWIAKTANRL